MASAGSSRQQRRGCGTKVAYYSQTLAGNAAVLHDWAGRPGMAGYKCDWCPDWHVGHPNPHHRDRPASPQAPVAVEAHAAA